MFRRVDFFVGTNTVVDAFSALFGIYFINNHYSYVVMAFEAITYNTHREHVPADLLQSWQPSVQADSLKLLNSITDFDFIATFNIMMSLLSPLEGITRKLQGKSKDICSAYSLVSCIDTFI